MFNFCFDSIFFEPDAFYCKPEELELRENGGVALLTGHKVQVTQMVSLIP